jgi:hypothetical protein
MELIISRRTLSGGDDFCLPVIIFIIGRSIKYQVFFHVRRLNIMRIKNSHFCDSDPDSMQLMP